MFELAGSVTRFAWRAMRGMPRARAYGGEVLRQIGILATGSTIVVMLATLMVGQSCGLESSFLGRSIGTPSIAPAATFGCSVLYVVPFLFGFILAAKVGCGFVAEIGAMRVSDEIDALEVIGIDSMVYIVSARMLAGTLFLPVMYMLAIGMADLGGFIQTGIRFHDISRGTYNVYQYAFYGPTDVLLSLAQGLVISAVVMSVALYYGYNVRGGPVEVGVATAKSMAVNLVLVTWVNLVFVILFLLKPRIPIA
jgi:phospholipid/cholesterol/gamma-HCH transport system permease protein